MTAYIIGGLAAFLLLLAIRAALFKPPLEDCPGLPLALKADRDKAAAHLSAMVECRTLSPRTDKTGKSGFAEFEKFRQLLKDFYPLTHQSLEFELIEGHSLLYRWAGKSSEKPLLLMAHYDVVPANDEQWQHPPFDGVIAEGLIWGRGTLDTKATLCGIFEAVEFLLADGFKPNHDIYLAFGHDEETMGSGAPAIVDVLKERGVRPEMVLDEGGAIIQGVFPGVSKPIAVIGMAEKGVADIEVILEGSGGHSSTPGRINPLGEMSKIITALGKNPFQAHLPGEVREMFAVLGRHMPFGFRLIFANLWFFKPLLTLMLPLLSRELNALCRTTLVFTLAEGSKASNVIPDRVRTVANLRLAAIDPLEKALDHVRNQALKSSKKAREAKEPLKLDVKLVQGHNASPSSSTASAAYANLAQTIGQIFSGTIVTPYIMLGASDSRHYCVICDNVLRFSPIQMSKEELNSIHGVDERIPVEKLGRIVDFYLALISKS